jgi:hypothetical protein
MALSRGSFAPMLTIVAKNNVAALNAAVALCTSIAITRSALDDKRCARAMVSWWDRRRPDRAAITMTRGMAVRQRMPSCVSEGPSLRRNPTMALAVAGITQAIRIREDPGSCRPSTRRACDERCRPKTEVRKGFLPSIPHTECRRRKEHPAHPSCSPAQPQTGGS